MEEDRRIMLIDREQLILELFRRSREIDGVLSVVDIVDSQPVIAYAHREVRYRIEPVESGNK